MTSCKVVLASEVSASFRNEIHKTITERGIRPKLVGFLANHDPAAVKYAEWTAKTCEETGVDFELRKVDKQELEDKVIEANEDDDVNGIMVYYPVFGDRQDQYLQNIISTGKDVEGLCHTFVQNMYHNVRYLDKEQKRKCIIPCTPLAIVKVYINDCPHMQIPCWIAKLAITLMSMNMLLNVSQILEYIGVYNSVLPYGNHLYGKTITVINRSEVVGRPLAALLANDGARVFSVDINGVQEFSRGTGIKLRKHEVKDSGLSVEQCVPLSDVVITGVPTASYKLPTEWLKDGVVAINFSTHKNFSEDVKSRAAIYVPSVGKVTVAMLERNLLRLHDHQHGL
ncbi:hypothetical protein BC938DRAFT_481554 [Jimgerdemannia flammicorona]|uniref:Tetrahydrofolate dehydrogenase/cyclohydrolase catalytic domain-containing protein n=1 Tax=Jimgerdemannia flammicorona TaxID=994334 RepID=A0A433QFV7_9FUNG|nr:hypothetical protein BC938DRAFT_481554 [Jimgerdemannia flammicorona]